MNKKFDEDELMFVAKHYKEGRMNVDDAWKKLAERDKGRQSESQRLLLVAASVLLLAGVVFAIGIFSYQRHTSAEPSRQSVAVADTGQNSCRDSVEKDTVVVFRFNRKPINAVLRELSSRYGVQLSASDTTKRVTGEFEVRSVEEAVNILEMTLDVKISRR